MRAPVKHGISCCHHHFLPMRTVLHVGRMCAGSPVSAANCPQGRARTSRKRDSTSALGFQKFHESGWDLGRESCPGFGKSGRIEANGGLWPTQRGHGLLPRMVSSRSCCTSLSVLYRQETGGSPPSDPGTRNMCATSCQECSYPRTSDSFQGCLTPTE